MNSSDGKEWYGIGLDTSQFQKEAQSVINDFRRIDAEAGVASQGIDRSFNIAAKSIGGLLTVAAAKGFIDQVTRIRGEFQQLEIAFSTMLGSEEKAMTLMNQLTRTAAVTPFDLSGVATGAKQLLAYGFELENVNDELLTLGDIAAGIGAPLNDLVYLYGTLRASGRVMTMDIRQFANRGIPIYEELSKVLGVSKDKINEMVTAGKVGFSDIQKAFRNLTSEGGKFSNLMEKQSASIVGLKSNLGDAIDMAANDLGKKLEPAIQKILQGGIDLAENYEKVGKTIAELIAVYGTYRTVLIVTMAVQKLNMQVLRQAVREKRKAAMSSIQLSNAEAIAAARTKMFALAQQSLVKSLKAARSAMLANPYTLIAAAIAGIAFAIYKVVTSKNEFEKATDRMNNAHKEAEKGALSEQRELARLRSELDATKKGTDEYNKVKEEIVKKYGKYDKTLSAEIEQVGLLQEKYDDLTESIQRSYDARQFNKFMEEQTAALEDVMSDNLDKIYETLTKKFGASLGGKYYSMVKAAILEGKKSSLQIQGIIGRYEDNEYGRIPSIKRFIDNIQDAIRATEEAEERARQLFGVLKKGASEGEDVEGPQPKEVRNKEYWVKQKEDAEIALEAMDSMEKGTKEWLKYQKQIIDAQAEIDKYTIQKNAKKDKLSQQEMADRLADIQEAKNRLKEAEIDAQYEIWQAKINAMNDGFDKERAQIELNYQKTITENRRLAEEMVKAQQDIERKQWEAKHPDWKEKGITFTPSTTRVTDLEQTQQNQLAERDKRANELKLQAEDELVKALLLKYADYNAQRKELERQFNEDLKALQASRTEENAAAIDAAIEEQRRQLKESLADLDFSEFKEGDMYAKLFTDLERIGTETLRKILIEAEKVNTKAWNPEDARTYQDRIEKFRQELNTRNPFKALGKAWKDMIDSIDGEDKDKLTEATREIERSVTKITSDLQSIGEGIGSMLGENAEYASENISDMIGGFGDLAKSAAQFASGDILGGITSAVSGLAKIASIFKRIKNENEKIKSEIRAFWEEARAGEMKYQMLIRERLRIEQMIGETTLGYHQRISKELEKQRNASQSDYDKMLKKLQQMTYVVGQTNISGGLFRKARIDTIYESLRGKTYEQIEKLYTEGRLEEQAMKLFEALRELRDEGVEIDEMLAENAERFREALSGLTFDSMRDSFMSFMQDGRVEASETAEYMRRVFRDAIMNSMMVNVFDSKLQALTDKIQDSVEEGTLTENIGRFQDEAKLIAREIDDALMAYSDIFADVKEQEASRRGFETMSQDTASELNGRFTALQMYGSEISTASQAIQVDVAQIKVANQVAADKLMELRDISLSGIDYLAKVERNTRELYQMNDRLGKIEENTRGL